MNTLIDNPNSKLKKIRIDKKGIESALNKTNRKIDICLV